MAKTSSKATRVLLWVILLALIPVVVFASWAGTEFLLDRSSGAEFCSSCHTMEPMVISYEMTKHGGNNKYGIKAQCADCHLPHEGAAKYLLTKARNGAVDVWKQLTYDESNPTNWTEKRKNRHQYVFDSGCMKCHSEKSRGDDPSHPSYFAGGKSPFKGQEKFRCVDCHFYVGHSDASEWIRATNAY